MGRHDQTSSRNTLRIVGLSFLTLFIVFILTFVFIGSIGAGFFASLVKGQEAYTEEEMQESIYSYAENSTVHFASGEQLGELPSELERQRVELDNVSTNLQNAFLSTEDRAFYEHNGINPQSLMRATYQEVTNSSTQTGGSTLTQQIVKNQLLTREVSFERKAKEVALALRMETYFTKDELFQAYMNIVPFGRNANGENIAGAQAAAQGIFGVDASELNIAQSAYIAGLPQNPYTYTPFESNGDVKDDLSAGLNRKNEVLHNMLEIDSISQEEFDEAMNYDIRSNLAEPKEEVAQEYPYLINETQRRATQIMRKQMLAEDNVQLENLSDEERQETIQQYNQEASREVSEGGYDIELTVHKDTYDAMQQAVEDNEYFGPEKEGEAEQVGGMMIENNSGAILSFVGGRDFETSSLNYATQTRRQNGSTMKPLLDYGPAIEEGILHPGQTLLDIPTEYGGDDDELNNFDGEYEGFIDARSALAESRNIPAVRVFDMLDESTREEALTDLGMGNVVENGISTSTAIGGLSRGVSVEQNTSAFTTFPAGGEHHEPYMVASITDNTDETVFEHEEESTNPFSEQTSFLITDILRDVLGPDGTASSLPERLNIDGDWAGKTGTTNNQIDSWFVGYNPNVTFGLWLGYNEQISIEDAQGLSYSQRTQQIWADVMNAASNTEDDLIGAGDTFSEPEGISTEEICGLSGKQPTDLCEEAGLVNEDILNEEFAPTEEDDSLEEVEYVTIDGDRYPGYDDTPSEFMENGISLNENYLLDGDEEEVQEYLPDDWDNVVPDEDAPENNRDPSRVTGVSNDGGTLTWSASSDNDVIGYRIFNDGEKAGNVIDRETTEFDTNGNGEYTVRAVDTHGRESNDSNGVDVGGSTDDSDSNNNNGNNDSGNESSENNEDANSNNSGNNNNNSNDNNDEDNGSDNSSNNGNDNQNSGDSGANDSSSSSNEENSADENNESEGGDNSSSDSSSDSSGTSEDNSEEPSNNDSSDESTNESNTTDETENGGSSTDEEESSEDSSPSEGSSDSETSDDSSNEEDSSAPSEDGSGDSDSSGDASTDEEESTEDSSSAPSGDGSGDSGSSGGASTDEEESTEDSSSAPSGDGSGDSGSSGGASTDEEESTEDSSSAPSGDSDAESDEDSSTSSTNSEAPGESSSPEASSGTENETEESSSSEQEE
ncbi:transglycosylase domain-containing protein [Marinococcus halophilus]|uniref:transglycosylase domain-containing protein n=2 Tax=Marinococcus halophilus TaxID=1371 RepID=UPI00361357C4